jgi:uroporphyrin-III C-methyltransferase/precorrin-2 dehydrogenase/sirohydrochlorin ferrochelatase
MRRDDVLVPPAPDGGFVSIVGAGPGAPDLLTCRAVNRLEHADLVLYDGLVPQAVARLARAARTLRVSRRPDSERVAPAVVAALMVEAARDKGQRVVRLRAGDPFVLGRGAEEALALAASGVPFEIVPGVSSAWSAATLAGIPLTHRGVASGFVVLSGHAPEAYEPVLGALPPHSATIVMLMGIAERARIAELLLRRGWRAGTPAAIVFSASQADQQVRRLTLAALPPAADDRPGGAPGVIVIGDVVEIGARLESMLRARTVTGGGTPSSGWSPRSPDPGNARGVLAPPRRSHHGSHG